MTANPDMLLALRGQARAFETLGSPFNAALNLKIAEDMEAGGPAAALHAPWAGADLKTIIDQGAQGRLVNALHHLAMSGEAPDLAAAFPAPGRPWDAEAAWGAARAGLTEHGAHLAAFMGHEPQTNEVRRSACLLGGFLTVAAETGLPLRCFEVGASAGLNQFWDRFHYCFGGAEWGDPASAVRLDTDWFGGLPPLVAAEVVERAACDRRPSDLADPAQRRRLLANIWPDQFERLERSRRAIELALASGVAVETADALAWTRQRVAVGGGTATVLYHSVFWQYLPAETRTGLRAAILDAAADATARAPFAWLRMEPSPGDGSLFEVRLTLWPDGSERLLAEVHPHGAWVKWF